MGASCRSLLGNERCNTKSYASPRVRVDSVFRLRCTFRVGVICFMALSVGTMRRSARFSPNPKHVSKLNNEGGEGSAGEPAHGTHTATISS